VGVCRSCLSLRIALPVQEAVGFVPRNRCHGGGSGFDASESRMSDACGQGFDSPHLHPQHNRLRRMGRVCLS